MQDDAFEWDDAKARRNRAKHNVSFEATSHAFSDPSGIDEPDDRDDDGEQRYNRFGLVHGHVLVR